MARPERHAELTSPWRTFSMRLGSADEAAGPPDIKARLKRSARRSGSPKLAQEGGAARAALRRVALRQTASTSTISRRYARDYPRDSNALSSSRCRLTRSASGLEAQAHLFGQEVAFRSYPASRGAAARSRRRAQRRRAATATSPSMTASFFSPSRRCAGERACRRRSSSHPSTQRCTTVPPELESTASDVLLGSGENEFVTPEER